MSDFIPYEYKVLRPSGGSMQTSAPASSGVPSLVIDSILIPLSRTIDLSTIAGGGVGSAGVVYERDYFLFHQTDLAAQRVTVTAAEDTEQTDFSVQVIADVDGSVEELSEVKHFLIIPQKPDPFAVTLAVDRGAVFLRVRSTYQATEIFVTIEVLTSRVP